MRCLLTAQFLVAFMALLSSNLVSAKNINCIQPSSTLEIDSCQKIKYNNINLKLNNLFNQKLNELSRERKTSSELQAIYRDLRDAQQAWIKYREKDCSAIYNLFKQGSIRTSKYLECKIKRTSQRIKELYRWGDL